MILSVSHLRAIAFPVTFSLLAAGCASQANDPTLTPAENQMHQRAAQMSNTVGEGAGVGVLAGAIAGALLSKNHLQGAAIGAAVGGAVGSGLGYMVASRAQAQQQTEGQYEAAIKQANITAQEASQDAMESQRIATDVTQKLAELNEKHSAKLVTDDSYQRELNSLRARNQDLAQIANGYQVRAQSMATEASAHPNDSMMRAAAQKTKASADQIKAQETMLASTLGETPESPPIITSSPTPGSTPAGT